MGYLDSLLQFITSPVGILACSAAIFGAALGLRKRWLLPYFIVIPLFVSCFGKYRYIEVPFAFPLEQILTLSRPVFVLGLLLMTPICLFVLPQTASRKPHAASVFLFIFQIVYALRLINEGDTEFGFLALGTFILSIVAIYSLRGALPTDKESAAAIFCYALTATGVFFAMATSYQYLANPSASKWAGRFIGITNNSIHTGEYSGWFLISTLAVSLSFMGRQKYRMGCAFAPLIVLHLGIILATGSRTALLLTFSGFLVLFRKRLSSQLIPVLLIPIALGLLNEFYSDFDRAAEYLGSGTDSRSQLFLALWQRFIENPVFGEIKLLDSGRVRIRENSYLTAAANLGLFGLLPLLACFFAYFSSARKAIRGEKIIKKQIIFSDWALAIMVSAFTAAFFEGFLFAIIGPAALLMHIGFSLVDSPILASTSPPHLADVPGQR